MLTGYLSTLKTGDEVILHTVDDTGGDHEEIAVIWAVKDDFLVTSNGSVLTNESDFGVTATGINFESFSYSSDALKKYRQLITLSHYENFDTVVE